MAGAVRVTGGGRPCRAARGHVEQKDAGWPPLGHGIRSRGDTGTLRGPGERRCGGRVGRRFGRDERTRGSDLLHQRVERQVHLCVCLLGQGASLVGVDLGRVAPGGGVGVDQDHVLHFSAPCSHGPAPGRAFHRYVGADQPFSTPGRVVDHVDRLSCSGRLVETERPRTWGCLRLLRGRRAALSRSPRKGPGLE